MIVGGLVALATAVTTVALVRWYGKRAEERVKRERDAPAYERTESGHPWQALPIQGKAFGNSPVASPPTTGNNS